MSSLLRYLKNTFILELKKTLAYPTAFWMVAFTVPFYSLVQIIFLESIYSQTNNFVGYSKYEAYILFGTYIIVQTVGHFFFYNRLSELKGLIRGGAQESLDMVLIKPVEAQVFATLGRYNFGNIGPFLIAVFIVGYGFWHQPALLNVLYLPIYFVLILFGLAMFYLTLLFFSILLFWVPDIQVTEALWTALGSFGQYPSQLYKGALGITLNLLIPITLMAAVPVEVLLGKMAPQVVLLYAIIISLLFLLTRLFWNFSLRKYSSSSS